VHLVGFIVGIYHDEPSPERQNVPGKLSVHNLGTLMLGFNSVSWVLDFPYIAATSVLTVTDDNIHSHRLYYYHN
jgi:hypothetical protein